MANMTPFGYGAINPEDEEILQQMIRRVNATGGDPASVQAGGEAFPFGMGIAVQDMPKGQARLPNGEAPATKPLSPATSPWRTTFERTEPLEQGATPQKMSVPQTAPVTQQQRRAEAGPPSEANPKPAGQPTAGAQRMAGGATPVAQPNFWDRLGAFSQGYNKGGLVGAVAAGMGTGLDREVEGQNMTLDALIRGGVDPKLASAAIRNPDLMKVLLQYHAGKSTPDIKTIKQRDKYGRETEISVVYNPMTRGWERVTIDGGEATPASPGMESGAPAPSAAPGGGGGGAPSLPAPMPSMASGPAQAAPAASPAATSNEASDKPIPPGWRENRNVPLSSLPDPKGGYSYDAPNGYPLEDANGNLKMIPTSEMAAKAKANEKRAEAEVEAEQQQAGVKNILKTGRVLAQQPGFDDALKMGRADVLRGGLPYIGEISPAQWGYGFARASDPNNPVWGVADDIKATQKRLELVIARPLMKGQGSVAGSERQLIADSIANLDKATSKADFIFRLNSIERMIEDMYAGKKVGNAESYSARPTLEELRSVYNGKTPEEIEGKMVGLSRKYNVGLPEMKDYVMSSFEKVGTGTAEDRAAQEEAAKPWYNKPPFYIPQLDVRNYLPGSGGGGGQPAPAASQAPPRGIPNQAPPGARDLPPNSGYPPGSKASRDPNNPNRWIIWTPD